MRLEGVLNLGHQKLPRQVAGRESCVVSFRVEGDVNTWEIWVARRMAAEIWERVVCSMILARTIWCGTRGLEVER